MSLNAFIFAALVALFTALPDVHAQTQYAPDCPRDSSACSTICAAQGYTNGHSFSSSSGTGASSSSCKCYTSSFGTVSPRCNTPTLSPPPPPSPSPSPSPSPPPETGDALDTTRNCKCSCCKGIGCTSSIVASYSASSSSECGADSCRSQFSSVCPASGSSGSVQASYSSSSASSGYITPPSSSSYSSSSTSLLLMWGSEDCASKCGLLDNKYYGSCGAFATKNDDNWCTAYGSEICCGASDADCCNPNGGVIAGVVIAGVVFLALSITACAFCCKCCCFKPAPAPAVMVATVPMGQVPTQMQPVMQPQVQMQPMQQMPPKQPV